MAATVQGFYVVGPAAGVALAVLLTRVVKGPLSFDEIRAAKGENEM